MSGIEVVISTYFYFLNAGDIPPELSQLSSLISLNVNYNNLSGSRFDVVISTCVYYMNAGIIPPELSQLSSLISLDLGYNNLSGSHFDAVA